jgi:hypothetical protein
MVMSSPRKICALAIFARGTNSGLTARGGARSAIHTGEEAESFQRGAADLRRKVSDGAIDR